MCAYYRKRPSRHLLAVIIAFVVIAYGGILVSVQYFGSRLEFRHAIETVGSLGDRFTANELRFDCSGRSYAYKTRDLTNILILGLDWMEHVDDSAPERYSALADFLVLVTIDQNKKSISMLQINRDAMTPIRVFGPFGDDAGTQTLQICLSHAYGHSNRESCTNTVWAVSQLLGGIPIDAYIALDIGSIAIINDLLGGITVTLEDDFSVIDSQMTAGKTLRLRGQQAETFVRKRIGIGTGTNMDRMRRQQVFIRAASQLITQKISRNMDFVGTLLDRLSGHLTTNAERGWLINEVYMSQGYERLDIRTLAGKHKIGPDGFMEFWPDQNVLNSFLIDVFFEDRGLTKGEHI